jgi:hypothetical protein
MDNSFDNIDIKHLTIHESFLDHREPTISPDGVTLYLTPDQGRQMLVPSSEELSLKEIENDVRLSEDRLGLNLYYIITVQTNLGGPGQYRVSLKRRHIY